MADPLYYAQTPPIPQPQQQPVQSDYEKWLQQIANLEFMGSGHTLGSVATQATDNAKDFGQKIANSAEVVATGSFTDPDGRTVPMSADDRVMAGMGLLGLAAPAAALRQPARAPARPASLLDVGAKATDPNMVSLFGDTPIPLSGKDYLNALREQMSGKSHTWDDHHDLLRIDFPEGQAPVLTRKTGISQIPWTDAIALMNKQKPAPSDFSIAPYLLGAAGVGGVGTIGYGLGYSAGKSSNKQEYRGPTRM